MRRRALVTDKGGWPGEPVIFATFIVRISQDSVGGVSGVVEWVRTGEKVRVSGLLAVSDVIGRMVERAKEMERRP